MNLEVAAGRPLFFGQHAPIPGSSPTAGDNLTLPLRNRNGWAAAAVCKILYTLQLGLG